MHRVTLTEENANGIANIARVLKRIKQGKELVSYRHFDDPVPTNSELCPCGEPQNHDAESDFFVTCVRDAGKPGQRTLPILGPYATHDEALENVGRGRALATEKDPFCDFDSFGTVKTEAGRWKGMLGV